MTTDPSGEEFRRDLEPAGWGAAYREGHSLPWAEIGPLAVRMLEDFEQTLGGPNLPATIPLPSPAGVKVQPVPSAYGESSLSDREQQLVRLVAQGLTSKAIGRQLLISTSTVNQHLASVFHKLGVDTRAQAVAVAAQKGLL